MAKRTVKDLDVAGKRVIVRCDFNVPRKDGKITNDNRIIQALPTIKYLVENNAKIILMSHLGKVKTEEDKAKNDLRCVAERLNELVDTKVTFVPVTRGEELENAVMKKAKAKMIRSWLLTGQSWVTCLLRMHSGAFTVHMLPLQVSHPFCRMRWASW